MQYSKAQVKFKEAARQRLCGLCKFFVSPNGCIKVMGYIPSRGTCGLWKKGRIRPVKTKPFKFIYGETGHSVMPGLPSTDPIQRDPLFAIDQDVVLPSGARGKIIRRTYAEEGFSWAYGIKPLAGGPLVILREKEVVPYKPLVFEDLEKLRDQVAGQTLSQKEGVSTFFGKLRSAGILIGSSDGWGTLRVGKKRTPMKKALNMLPGMMGLKLDASGLGKLPTLKEAKNALNIWKKITDLYNQKKGGYATATSSKQKWYWDNIIKKPYQAIADVIKKIQDFVKWAGGGFQGLGGLSTVWGIVKAIIALHPLMIAFKWITEKAEEEEEKCPEGEIWEPITETCVVSPCEEGEEIDPTQGLCKPIGWVLDPQTGDYYNPEDPTQRTAGVPPRPEYVPPTVPARYEEACPPCEYAAEGESDWWFGTHQAKDFTMKVKGLGAAGPSKGWYITPPLDISLIPTSWNETGADLINGLIWVLFFTAGLMVLPKLFAVVGTFLKMMG